MTGERICYHCKKEIKKDDTRTFYNSKEIHVKCLPSRPRKKGYFEIVEDLNPRYLLEKIHSIVLIQGANLSNIMTEIVLLLDDYLYRLFKFHKTPENRLIDLLTVFFPQSSYMNHISNYVKNLLKKKGEKGLADTLKDMVAEQDELKQFFIYEAIVAGNWSRAEYHKSTDSKNINRYIMSVFLDNRTSPQCREIKKRQGLLGLPLEELRLLIREVAYKYEPNESWRDYEPHKYCRSILVRQF